MTESKQSQSNDERFPEVKPTEPGSDTPYIAPIIGKLGYDTDRPWLFGLGTSPDNGVNFHVFLSFDGLSFDGSDVDKLFQVGASDRVKKIVDAETAEIPAVESAANEAVKRAEAAVANSKVNSDAIVAMQSAAAEAKSGADQALSAAQAAIKNVASDAAAIRQHVSDVESAVSADQQANSSAVQQLRSDVSTAKQNIATANDTLTKAQAAIDQTNKELSTYTEQAKAQGKTINELQKTQDSVKQTIADVQGNVSQVEQSVTGLEANLKDAQGDVATLKARADGFDGTMADYQKNISNLTATAKSLQDAMKNAQGDITTAMQTASAASVTASDAKSDVAEIAVTASGAKAMAQDANSNATEAKLTASSAAVVASDAKSNVMTATATASEAKLVATNANSQAMDAKAAASEVSVTLSGVERTAADAASQASAASSAAGKAQSAADANAQTITTVQASVKATQTELSGKVDKATVDDVNRRLNDTNAQVKVVAGEVSSKAEQTTVTSLNDALNSLRSKTEITENDDLDFNDCKTQMDVFTKSTKNAPNTDYWWYLRVVPSTVADGRITQYATADRDSKQFTRQFVNNSWTPWVQMADSNDIANIQAQVTKQSTEISNNTSAINLKADKTTVDTINHSVQQQQAQQQVLADQIKTKVTSSDVEGILTNGKYATQDYTQTLLDQTSKTLNANITEVKRSADANHQADVDRMTNLQASIDGVQTTVKGKADQSQITQLSNVIQSKISASDFNDLKSKVEWTENDTIDFNNCKSQMNVFAKSSTNAPNDHYWWYLRVIPGVDGRVTQYATSDRDDKHYTRQLVDGNWSTWRQDASESEISQLKDDINLRVKQGDLISQINLEAGRTLIQSKKIYLDADSVVFGGKAFIPDAAITSIDADKITSGYIRVPMSDGNGNTIQISNDGIDILSNNQNTKLFSANRGIASVHIDASGMTLGATTNGVYEKLGGFSPLLDSSDGTFSGQENHNGIGFVVETQQQFGYPYGGDFFSLARSIKAPPSYYNGFLYEATGSGKHEIGSHFFDPIYIHPYGAANYLKSTWVSWTAWDNNERYPAIVQAGPEEGGVAFPKSGEVTLFDAAGHAFTPGQWKGAYTDYQHEGAGNAYHDPGQST